MTKGRLLLVPVLVLVVLVAIAVAASRVVRLGRPGQSATAGQATYGIVTPAQLNSMLAKKDFSFINVHVPYEGEIEQTDAFIPYDEIDKNLAQLPADKKAKIVLYCRSGRMSSMAAEELVKRGFSNVSHLDGGMAAWQAAGYSTVDRKR